MWPELASIGIAQGALHALARPTGVANPAIEAICAEVRLLVDHHVAAVASAAILGPDFPGMPETRGSVTRAAVGGRP